LKGIACIGILFIGVVADVGTNYIRRNLIASRAVKLADACRAYRAKYNNYPKRLNDLVPEFISSVRPARVVFLGEDDLLYYAYEGPEPFLYYNCLPPFGRCYYYVESRCWRFLD